MNTGRNKVELYQDKHREWRWRLIRNGRIIADCAEGYSHWSKAIAPLKALLESRSHMILEGKDPPVKLRAAAIVFNKTFDS